MSQRRLVDELKVAIDRAVAGDSLARLRVDMLIFDNPRSVWSFHVTYNIGKRRASWLRAHARASADLSRATTHSSGRATRDDTPDD